MWRDDRWTENCNTQRAEGPTAALHPSGPASQRQNGWSSDLFHRFTLTYGIDLQQLWENTVGWGKDSWRRQCSLLVFAWSPTVFILDAVVLEIPTREQSEEKASYGAEPRQAGGQRSDNICDREWWKTNSWLSSNKMTHTHTQKNPMQVTWFNAVVLVFYQQHSKEMGVSCFSWGPWPHHNHTHSTIRSHIPLSNLQDSRSIISLNRYWSRWEINTSMVPIQPTTMDHWCITSS